MTGFERDLLFYFSRLFNRPLVAPDVLQLSIISECNLRCLSCNVWRQGQQDESILTLAQIREILKEAAAWGVKEVHLLGGEPLLRKDWPQIVSAAKSLGMFVVICTNGTLLNEETILALRRSKVDLLSISLDGAAPQTHDHLRGQEGAYELIVSGIRTLKKAGDTPQVVMILTVSEKNLDELKRYVDLAESLRADGIYFTALVLDNVAMFSQKKTHDLWIKEKDFHRLDALFQEAGDYAASKKYFLNYPSFKLFSPYFRGCLKKGTWVCFSGFKRLVVTPSGDVQICGEMIGSYRETASLRKIWSSVQARRRRNFVKRCTTYCLQDCHSRPESNSLMEIFKRRIKKK